MGELQVKRQRHIWIMLAALVAGLGFVAPASAITDPTQTRIDYVLANYPGGVQTEWNEVSWGGGDVVLTVAGSGVQSRAAVGTCASGKHCVYSSPGLLGSKLTFSTCSNQSVSALGGPVKSVANARSSGTVTAKNGSTAVLSVAPGAYKNTSATVTQVSCS